jgi:hypothetical protein
MAGQGERHVELFRKLDLEGWNGPDWELFRQLHTDDVVVDLMGQRTEGLEAHVTMCRQIIEQSPDLKVVGHPVTIAEGEWTAVVGELTGGQRMVTVARWRDGAIAEELVFLGGEPATPDPRA